MWLPSVGISESCGGGFGGVCATGGVSCGGSGLASGGVCSGGMGGGEGVLPWPAGDDVGFTSHVYRSSGEDNLVPPAANNYHITFRDNLNFASNFSCYTHVQAKQVWWEKVALKNFVFFIVRKE